MATARPAAMAPNVDVANDSTGEDALPYQQCVPFARQTSGIQLFGDALSWWDQAAGQYARGHVPQVGAVMSFRPHAAMHLGHVAMVSRIIDPRTVLLRHANWSPVDGRRGHVELDVRAVDVSPANDWSEVRVWYHPIGDLGTTRWPVNGFIYKHKPGHDDENMLHAFARAPVLAMADHPRVTRLNARYAAASGGIDSTFLDDTGPDRGGGTPRAMASADPVHAPTRNYLVARPRVQKSALATSYAAAFAAPSSSPSQHDDPIGRIIAARMSHSTD